MTDWSIPLHVFGVARSRELHRPEERDSDVTRWPLELNEQHSLIELMKRGFSRAEAMKLIHDARRRRVNPDRTGHYFKFSPKGA